MLIQWFIIGVETIILIIMITWMGIQEKENSHLAEQNENYANESESDKEAIGKLQADSEKMRKEIQALVKSRLPDLIPLTLDEVMEINEGIVKKFSFTLTGKKDKRVFEYKLILQNNTKTDIHVDLELLFFNRIGYQVASAKVGSGKSGVPAQEILEAGEIRSFESSFELQPDAEPEYLKIMTRH
ncbi:MAG: hypothetical protein PHE55_15510 [Methylococcaceae bacterium]|nr:hypothetical protein [Methylococcaceae bacterium]